jgi:UrcA family protein
MNKINLLASAIVIFAAAAPAAAAAPPGSFAVAYGDLDLASPGGLAKLDERVRKAAARLCSDHAYRPLPNRTDERECVEAAIGAADRGVQQAIADYRQKTRLAARQFLESGSR